MGVAFYGKVNIGTSDANARSALGLLAGLQNQEWRDKSSLEIAVEIRAFYASKQAEAGMTTAASERDQLGILVFGSGLVDSRPAIHRIVLPGEQEPETIPPAGQYGVVTAGENSYVNRLLYGIDPKFDFLIQSALSLSNEAIAALNDNLKARGQLITWAAMPLQDAVNLADFLVYVTKCMQDWSAGDKGVGGPTDIAIAKSGGVVKFLRQKSIVAPAAIEEEVGVGLQDTGDSSAIVHGVVGDDG